MKTKPYYSDKDITLYHSDAIKCMAAMPEDSIDMIFADPPYLLSNGGITVKNGRMASVNKADWDESSGIESDYMFHKKWLDEAQRILKPNGTIWISGTYHSIFLCGHVMQTSEFKILNDIVWFKPNGAPNISCRYFTASHETLIWAAKSKKSKHIFNYDLMKFNKWENDNFKKDSKQMRSVWCIPTTGQNEKKFGKHPTQKPVNLLARIIQAASNEGDTILDPFSGSGTTGVAAIMNNRKYIGIDFNNEYLDLSIKRFRDTMESI